MPEIINIECIGYSVVADWYEGKSTDNIILILIGYTSNRKRYRNRIPDIVDETGMSALVFDYSGHGDSPFDIETTRPAQNFLEVIHVFDWLKEKYPDSEINVIGSSFGGYLSVQLTEYRVFNKLILRAPAIYQPSDFYAKYGDVDRERLRNDYRKNAAALAEHPLLRRTSGFMGKTLVIVHEKDDQVPAQTTDAYIKAFKADVYIANNFPHSLNNVPENQQVEYHKKISNWLKSP
jgi:esterase/lipase